MLLFAGSYRSDKVSYETARRWKEKFLTTTESVKYAAKSSRSVTITGKVNVSNTKKKIECQGRYNVVISPKLLPYSYRGCILYLSVFWKYERFQPDTVYIERWLKTGTRIIRWAIAKNDSHDQSKTICKYNHWWRNGFTILNQ